MKMWDIFVWIICRYRLSRSWQNCCVFRILRLIRLHLESTSEVAEVPELECILEGFKESGMDYEILFLDASDDVLIKRYKERGGIIRWREMGELIRVSKKSVPM